MSARVFCRSISIALRSISATFLLVGAAFAAEPVTADPVDFQISEQPLNSALNEFARQSDREIFYASDVVDGIYANSVDGKYEPEDALELLLADSGLEYSVTASDTFLVKAPRSPSKKPASGLAPMIWVSFASSMCREGQRRSRCRISAMRASLRALLFMVTGHRRILHCEVVVRLKRSSCSGSGRRGPLL